MVAGEWKRDSFKGVELAEKILGIVGLKLILDMKDCRSSTALLVVTAVCYVAAIAAPANKATLRLRMTPSFEPGGPKDGPIQNDGAIKPANL